MFGGSIYQAYMDEETVVEEGKSAYQVWLDNGNTGTEVDFLAWLKGEMGAQGDQGEQGEQGVQGVGIEKVEYDKDGNLIITFTDGTTQTVVVPKPEEHVHSFGNWKEFTEGDTYCEDKLFLRTCLDCNTVEWKQGAEDDHDWMIVTTNPTCHSQGYDTKTCEICDKVTVENYMDIIDHAWEKEYSYNASFHWIGCATCTEIKDKVEHIEGTSGECTICGQPVRETEGVLYAHSVDGTYAEVIGYVGAATKVRIAESYNGLPVKSIRDEVFNDMDHITDVIIPDSVTIMGNSVFALCSNLANVSIGSGLTTMGNSIFYECAKLANITVSENNTAYQSINGNLYNKDGSVLIQYAVGKTATRFTVPDTVKTIASQAFYYCEKLQKVVIPDGVTTIANGAFAWCGDLASVEIPNSVTSIGFGAFQCSGLTSIVIPDSVTELGDYLCYNCSKLTCVTIGNGVPAIGDMTFFSCSNLTSVVIPEKVATIGANAFGYCSRLASLVIGNSVTEIRDHAFSACGSLTSVEIPDSVASIGYGAFNSCGNLTNVTLGDGVRSIGDYAFNNCDNLTFNEYRNCKYLGTKNNPYHALIGVNNTIYNTYTIHEDAKMIANYAFMNCTRMENITIPYSVTSIGGWAFDGCNNLTVVYYQGAENDWSHVEGNGNLPDVIYYYSETQPTKEGNYWHYDENGEVAVWEVVIPNQGLAYALNENFAFYTVTGIGSCTDTDLVIPAIYEGLRVTAIGDEAFYDCDGLTSVEIPDSVTEIGSRAFEKCSSLTSVVIGDSVTTIGNYAFSSCSNLTSVEIPDSVTTIGERAFQSCSNLTSVVIGDGVTTIGNFAFSSCSSLTNITVSADNTAYQSIDGNLYSKDGTILIQYATGKTATEFIIPDSVTTICEKAFYDCSSLTSVVIGDGVTTIGMQAFDYCSSLTSVYYKGTASDWSSMSIGGFNSKLTNATRYYYDESETAERWWHYDENGETVHA